MYFPNFSRSGKLVCKFSYFFNSENKDGNRHKNVMKIVNLASVLAVNYLQCKFLHFICRTEYCSPFIYDHHIDLDFL